MAESPDYLAATRHPWPSLLFVLPLVLGYELGVLWLGESRPDALRNGADVWLRQGLGLAGLREFFWAPLLLMILLLLLVYRTWSERPRDLLGTLTGMGLESVAFALGLWALSRGLGPLIDYLGLELALSGWRAVAVRQVVTFIGAGIYEEAIFRLVLFSLLLAAARGAGGSAWFSVGFAALASALIFSTAHYIGPHGEPFEGYTFLFRAVAGVYFALIYHFRGFGIAVGGHACYDVIVGVVV